MRAAGDLRETFARAHAALDEAGAALARADARIDRVAAALDRAGEVLAALCLTAGGCLAVGLASLF